jgi:hypothetical protein
MWKNIDTAATPFFYPMHGGLFNILCEEVSDATLQECFANFG